MTAQWLLSPRVVGDVISVGVLLPAIGAMVAAFQEPEGSGGCIPGRGGGWRHGSRSRRRDGVCDSGDHVAGDRIRPLFTLVLRDAGDRVISAVAFSLLFAGLVLATVEGSFQASVTVWAGEEYSRPGAVPESFEPLRLWLNVWLQRVYVPMALAGVSGYGWAIL